MFVAYRRTSNLLQQRMPFNITQTALTLQGLVACGAGWLLSSDASLSPARGLPTLANLSLYAVQV